MSTRTTVAPKPPAQLWGLWVVSRQTPEGYWWNHTHGVRRHADTPMTFISRDDALRSREVESDGLDYDTDTMTVALIGVAPRD